MTNKVRLSDKPEQYHFVSSDDTWDEVLEIYRRGVKRRVAIVRYWDADDLADSLVKLSANIPALVGACKLLLAELKAQLKSDDPKVRCQAARDHELIGGLQKAIAAAKGGRRRHPATSPLSD